MNTTTDAHPELGLEVPIGMIDKELRKLWADDDARTNASLVNLAVYSENPDALVENSRMVRELTREHACRALLIGIDRNASEASIRAWITAHCHLAHGMKSVCCEQIAFLLKGRATGRLRNTVFAHLDSDLPLILWWQGELSPLFEERLYSLIDRFVFDSSEWEDSIQGYERVSEAVEEFERLVIHDLEWTRSYQFRISVASLFDDPCAQAALDAVESLTIRHHPRHRNAALQLLAWFAVQAKWKDGAELGLGDARRNNQRESFSFEKPNGGGVDATLLGSETAHSVESLELHAEGTRISVSRADPGHLLRLLDTKGHRAESLGPDDPKEPVHLLGEQLSRGGRNSLFAKILPQFRRLIARSTG